MGDSSQQQLGNTLWAIADQLRGPMNAYNSPTLPSQKHYNMLTRANKLHQNTSWTLRA